MTGTVAIIGAGAIGRSWAILFAQAGWDARLWGRAQGRLDQALAVIDDQIDWLGETGLLAIDGAALRTGITATTDRAEAVASADLVLESLPEDLAVKRAMFAALDAEAGDGVAIASSSSGLPPSRFTEGLAGRGRCLVAHPVNPPHLIPVVELVPAPWTAPAVVDRVRGILQAIGRKPVTLNRETPGFLLNRLQGALANEAFRLVAEGFASPEDIDSAIADGLGLRWSFMGPFETLDLNSPAGLAGFAQGFADLFHEIAGLQAQSEPWDPAAVAAAVAARRRAVPLDALGERRVWRDRRLAALMVAKRAADREIGP